MIEAVKDILFSIFGVAGIAALTLAAIWLSLELLNKFFHLTKYIVKYHTYKRNEEMYDIKNKLIVSKNGDIPHSCVSDPDERIKILNKAIEKCNDRKKLLEKYKEEWQ